MGGLRPGAAPRTVAVGEEGETVKSPANPRLPTGSAPREASGPRPDGDAMAGPPAGSRRQSEKSVSGVPRRPRGAIHQPQPHRHPDDASLPLTATSPPPATAQDGGAEARRPTAHAPGPAFRFGPRRASASSSRISPALGTSHPVLSLRGEHPGGPWLPLGTVSESQATHGG